jgi:hypothetical protein
MERVWSSNFACYWRRPRNILHPSSQRWVREITSLWDFLLDSHFSKDVIFAAFLPRKVFSSLVNDCLDIFRLSTLFLNSNRTNSWRARSHILDCWKTWIKRYSEHGGFSFMAHIVSKNEKSSLGTYVRTSRRALTTGIFEFSNILVLLSINTIPHHHPNR